MSGRVGARRCESWSCTARPGPSTHGRARRSEARVVGARVVLAVVRVHRRAPRSSPDAFGRGPAVLRLAQLGMSRRGSAWFGEGSQRAVAFGAVRFRACALRRRLARSVRACLGTAMRGQSRPVRSGGLSPRGWSKAWFDSTPARRRSRQVSPWHGRARQSAARQVKGPFARDGRTGVRLSRRAPLGSGTSVLAPASLGWARRGDASPVEARVSRSAHTGLRGFDSRGALHAQACPRQALPGPTGLGRAWSGSAGHVAARQGSLS